MPVVVTVRALDGFRLEVVFDDGTQGVVCLADRLYGPVFEPLQDPSMFQQVGVDDFGAIAWPNGADLAPDAIYRRLRESAAVA